MIWIEGLRYVSDLLSPQHGLGRTVLVQPKPWELRSLILILLVAGASTDFLEMGLRIGYMTVGIRSVMMLMDYGIERIATSHGEWQFCCVLVETALTRDEIQLQFRSLQHRKYNDVRSDHYSL